MIIGGHDELCFGASLMEMQIKELSKIYAQFDEMELAVFALNKDGRCCYQNVLVNRLDPSIEIGDVVKINTTDDSVHTFIVTKKSEKLVCKRIKFIEYREDEIFFYVMFKEHDTKDLISELAYSKEKLNYLQNVLDCIYDQIYVLDRNANILMVNKAVVQKNYRRESLIGRNMRDLVREGYADDSVSLKIIKTGKAQGMIFPEQEGYDLLSWGIPHYDENGDIDFVVCTEWDIENLIHLRDTLGDEKHSVTSVQPELSYYRAKSSANDEIIAASPSMNNVLQTAGMIARSDATILIQGESGTGKELLVKFIYNNSERANASLIEVNCGAIPDNLVESELFGYEKGAFTGANQRGKPGLFEAASKGTLFLDEVGELPLTAQAALLRALQEKIIYRVGGVTGIPTDARIIAATNADLKHLVDNKMFREDLFYRLNVLPLIIPPLKERKEDIPLLIEHFARIFENKYKKNIQIDKQDYDLFINYSWPGNVRELRNLIERVSIIYGEKVIPRYVWIRYLNENQSEADDSIVDTEKSLRASVEEYEHNLILSYMPKYKNSRQFAELLGTDKSTINRKLKKYKIRDKIDD